MAVKFYNPGSRIYEKLAFDHPTNDIKTQNLISYYQIDAPEHGVFEVPTEIDVETLNGNQSVAVRFAERLQKDYREYGLVRIGERSKRDGEDVNVAPNEKEARILGDRLWREYLEAKAREYIYNVEQAYAMGAVPTRAKGVYAHALKTLGLEDPADKVGTAVKRTTDNDRVSQLEKQVADLMAKLGGK